MSLAVSELTFHAVCLCFEFSHLTKQIPTLHNITNLVNVLSIGCFIHLLLLYLSQCFICEVSLQNCKRYIGVVYRSPSQDSTEFENFLFDFDELLGSTASTNTLFTIILGDFNARSSPWWKKYKTTTEGTHLEALLSLHSFHQLISKPKHLLRHSNSCIDLIFTDQPNLVVNCGTHSSLNFQCHYQTTHCKVNLNIEYPPAYKRLVWDYGKAHINNIKNPIKSVNWECLLNSKTVDRQVAIFNEITILYLTSLLLSMIESLLG